MGLAQFMKFFGREIPTLVVGETTWTRKRADTGHAMPPRQKS